MSLLRARSLQLACAASLVMGGLVLGWGASPAEAATTGVYCPAGHLQAAIDAAAPGSTIRVHGTCTGHFVITKNLTLSGPATLDGGGSGTVLASSGSRVYLRYLTIRDGVDGIYIRHGALRLDSATVSQNTGGGIDNNRGTVTLTHDIFSDDSATYGGGVFNDRGTVTLTHDIFSNDSATRSGGGVYNDDGIVTLTNDTVSNDSATGCGGGVGSDGAATLTQVVLSNDSAKCGGGESSSGRSTTLTDDVLSHDSATDGGALYTDGGTATLNNSDVERNTASDGGGIYNQARLTLDNSDVERNTASDGGGIWNDAALTLSNSSVSHNMANALVGGIFNTGGGTVTEANSTVSGNQPTP